MPPLSLAAGDGCCDLAGSLAVTLGVLVRPPLLPMAAHHSSLGASSPHPATRRSAEELPLRNPTPEAGDSPTLLPLRDLVEPGAPHCAREAALP